MAYYNSRPDTLPDGPQPDGTYRLNGAVVSAADHAAAMATRGTNAALDAQARGQAIQTGDPAVRQSGYPIPPGLPHSAPPPSAALPPGMPPGYGPGVQPGYGGTNADAGINVNSYVGSRYSPDFAWSNPQLFTPPTGLPPVTADTLTQRQQLADANGKIPGRHYDPANIAAASPEWLASETAMLPSRLATVAAGQDRDALSKTLAGMPPGYDKTPVGQAMTNGVTNPKTLEDLGKAYTPTLPPARTGQLITVGGHQMYWQNQNQVAPFPDPKTQPQYFDIPKVMETNGFKFYQDGPGMPARPLPQSNDNALSPLVIASAIEKIATLEKEKADHEIAIIKGDNRFSFLNLRTRQDRIDEINAKIAALRTSIGGKGAPAGDATPNGQTPSAPAPVAAAPTAPATPVAPAKPATPAAPAKPAQGKLYSISGDQILFAHGDNMLNSVQQALDDGHITAESARTILRNAKFSDKAKK